LPDSEPPDDIEVNATEMPPAPVSIEPDSAWEHVALYKRVREALYALPSSFRPDLSISGVLATDLHTFNTSLGATIEAQVTDALNESREIWDPDKSYAHYRFVRQSQTFPDVILRSANPAAADPIIMGIELKGWFALAKEKEPSFRYKVTPAVCAPQDLLVVFPWALTNVISGTPILYPPFVIGARYAAEYRNWYWQHEKKGNSVLRLSRATNSYPAKTDPISDEAVNDAGGNFGRIARTNLMEGFKKRLFAEELSGIPIEAWIEFFTIFSQNTTRDMILAKLDNMAKSQGKRKPLLSDEAVRRIRDALAEIESLLQTDG